MNPSRRQWIVGGSAVALAAAAPAAQPLPKIRIGLAAATVGEFNTNDARAAFRVWRQTLGPELGLDVSIDDAALFDSAAVLARIRAGQLDAFGITLQEYRQVAGWVDPQHVLLDETMTSGGSEYVLLAHPAQNIAQPADLKGRAITIWKATATAVAEDWLEVLLAPLRIQPQLIWNTKLSKVVLPVFFRQTDAGVVTAAAYATLCELNPQLGRTLRVVARSARVVPSILGFHKACPGPSKEALLRALQGMHESATGKQVLALFQMRRVYARNVTALNESLELIAQAARLRAQRRVS